MNIQLQNVTYTYAGKYQRVTAVDGVSYTFHDGTLYTIMGASGSGKSTLLSLLAGLKLPTEGEITLDEQPIRLMDRSALRRDTVSVIYQDFNLFPLLTAEENVCYPLRLQKMDKEKALELARQRLTDMGIRESYFRKLPNQLSGGEQQRVAIARALVNRPKVLLLDEPLGALDLRLRKDMQNELKRIQQQMGITFIYVTHDQEEALTMSDTVVVMDKGRIQQIGTPEDIYNEPKNAFVADFIGESNILNGTMVRDNVVKMYGKEFPCVDGGFAPNEPVDVVIRPEDIDIVPVEQGQLVGTVTNVTFKGMQYDIIVDFRGFKWLIQTTDHSPVGARIGVKIDPDGFHIMKKSEYSGQFGDYSSYSEEYEELADASLETDEEEIGDEE